MSITRTVGNGLEFTAPVHRSARGMFPVCPSCRKEAAGLGFAGEVDHILKIEWRHLLSAAGLTEISEPGNAACLCTKCHKIKTDQETALRDASDAEKLEHYRFWYNECYTPKGAPRQPRPATIQKIKRDMRRIHRTKTRQKSAKTEEAKMHQMCNRGKIRASQKRRRK